MTVSQTDTRDISLLYKLSLAAGTSLDVHENCRHFLEALVNLMGLTAASVWLCDPEDKNSACNLFFMHPEITTIQRTIPEQHFIIETLQQQPFFSLAGNDRSIDGLAKKKEAENGAIAIFKLQETGFLKLRDKNRTGLFSAAEMEDLWPVIEKFSISLSGGISHEQLMEETENRNFFHKALQQVNRRYTDLFNSLYDAIIILDRYGNITKSNRAAKKLLGFESEDSPQINLRDIIHPEDVYHAKSNLKKLLKNGFIKGYEGRILTKTGQIRYVKVNSDAIFKNGKFAGSREIVLDITEQKLVETRIRESEEKYRGIIENMQVGLAEIDLNGIIRQPYRSFCQMTGYEAGELTGRNGIELIIPEDYQELLKHQLKLRSHGHLSVYEMQLRRKDGSLIWALISSAPMTDNQGKVTGAVFTAFDISDRKKMEDDLAEAKLIAEHARFSERQFLTNMSHEIRTPMNAVIGMTHLLYETNPNQSQKVYLDSLRFAADSLMGIIDNVLDLSKIEAGELEFEEKSFNLLHLMKSLQRSFQFRVKDKAISIDMTLDPAISYRIIGDPTRLNQILTNLLGNASKFTEKGRIGISTKLLQNNGEKYLIEFRVEDSGIGIPEDKLEDIFKNFKQANIKIARKYGGSGLGLTIVKQLVERQGGTIRVESNIGRGSVFVFTLPFKKSDIKATEKQQHYQMSQSKSRRFLKQLSLLVVEDNLMNQKLITKILDIWGCEYQVASDGLEALGMSLQDSYDLILMDIHMPEMDGCEATEKIRSNPASPNRKTPIIALTAAALLEEKKRALKAGMSDFLTKPFSPEMLESCMLQHLVFKTEEPEPAKEADPAPVHANFDYLAEFSNNDRDFIREMVNTFLAETPANTGRLNEALEHEDWKMVYKYIHTFKPSFLMFGMKDQHEKAIEIENLIKKEDFDKMEATEMIHWLTASVNQVYPVLESMKQQV